MAHDRRASVVLAYSEGNTAASKKIHESTAEWEEDGHNCGMKHRCESERLEAAIAGVCVTLIAGTALDEARRVLAVGVSGGIVTGLQKLSFERWYRRHYTRERAREKWELENYPKGEREEMTGLFTFKGMAHGDAKDVVDTMSEYHEFFVNLMMTEELELRAPAERTAHRAAAVGASFALAALLPLAVADVSQRLLQSVDPLFIVQFTALFILGLLGARRATMCVLHVKTHVLECIFLGIASILAPKLVLLIAS